MIPRGIGLLLRRELARLDRAPGQRRVVRALSLFGLTLVFMFANAGGPTAPFLALAWSQLILFSFLQPVRAAGIFVEGRLDGTLSLLALTPLRPWAVALGTCLAALALAAEGILVSLPLFAIAGVYADLAASDLARVGATILAGAFLSTCVGAAVGAKGGGRQAVSSGFMQSLVWMFLLFVISGVVFSVCEEVNDPALTPYLRPLGRIVFLPCGLLLGFAEGLYAPLFSFVFGVGVLGVATLRTSRAIRDEEDSRGGSRKWFSSLSRTPAAEGPGPAAKEPEPAAPAATERVPVPDQRVVAWREARRRGARGCFRPGWIAVAAVLFVFGSGIVGGLASKDYKLSVYFGLMLGSTLWLLLIAWGLMGGARAYVEDREDGTLELLLTTPRYDAWTLVKEKLRGALERGRWGISAGCLVHTVAVLGLGIIHDLGVISILMALSSIFVVWITGAWASLSVGQTYSLRAPSAARAQTWAAATAGIVFFIGLFSTCFVSAIWILPTLDAAPWIAGAIHYGLSLILATVALVLIHGLRQSLAWRALG